MGKILGDAQPLHFVLGLGAVGVGILLASPAGWADWGGIALFVLGGAQAGRHWGWWGDLSP